MIFKSILIGLVTFPLLMNTPDPPPQQHADSAPFAAELQKKEDTFAVEGKGDDAIFCIHSATGIGSAKITRRGGEWPATMTVRFQKMRMLEQFTAKIGNAQISGTLKSPNQPLYFDKDGKQQEKAAGSVFSLQILAMEADRGIEVRIGLSTDARQLDAMELHWIDAFR